MSEEYLVPHGYGEETLVEKKSRFIGRIWRVEREADALAKLKEIREKYWDASHHTFAYRIKQDNLMRYSDDGEPQGTAGMPILEVLRREELQNVCCIVTRYFGGTLLGAGGLTRAYGKAAKLALDAAGIDCMKEWTRFQMEVPYAMFDTIRRQLELMKCQELKMEYTDIIHIEAIISSEMFSACKKSVLDTSSGQIQAKVIENCFRGVQIR